MSALRWRDLATEGSATYSLDWTKRLPTGASLSSVAYSLDPNSGGLTFSSNSVASNISTITITADKTEYDYWVKLTPTLDTGSISPVSMKIKVVTHKEAR